MGTKKVTNAEIFGAVLLEMGQKLNKLRASCVARPGSEATGQEHPICSQFKFLLVNMLNTLDSTLRGQQNPGFYNITESKQNMVRQYEDMRDVHNHDEDAVMLNPRFDYVTSWLAYNNDLFEDFSALEAEIATTFQQLYGTPYTPAKRATRGAVAATVKKTDAEIKASRARLEAAKKAVA